MVPAVPAPTAEPSGHYVVCRSSVRLGNARLSQLSALVSDDRPKSQPQSGHTASAAPPEGKEISRPFSDLGEAVICRPSMRDRDASIYGLRMDVRRSEGPPSVRKCKEEVHTRYKIRPSVKVSGGPTYSAVFGGPIHERTVSTTTSLNV